ncbi:MAG: tetratricopeptide repeat protein [Planctomycetes bacterium]|nr:tetratricopeptide repeat protein [Planctomycetota bacterium]
MTFSNTLVDLDAAVTPQAREPAAAAGFNRRGITRFRAGDREGALDDFGEAIRHDPGCAEAWNNSGLVRHLLGNVAEAIGDFDQALCLNPHYADAWNNRARARQAQGDRAGARADLDRALACAPARFAVIVLHNRGALRQLAGDRAGALADFDRALELDPEHVAPYVPRGTARKEAGGLHGALADFDRALERVAPAAAASIWHHRGGVRVLLNDFAGAIRDYDQALTLDPGFYLAYISRGHARYHRRDRRAGVDYLLAFRLCPEATAREIERFLFEQAQREAAQVLANCEQHLRINPRDALAHARRGLTLVLLGREAEAPANLSCFRSLAGELQELLTRVLELARSRLAG